MLPAHFQLIRAHNWTDVGAHLKNWYIKIDSLTALCYVFPGIWWFVWKITLLDVRHHKEFPDMQYGKTSEADSAEF